jgi:uncharacterized protein YbbK (DUF523 family)
MQKGKIKIGVSACLLGEHVRYNAELLEYSLPDIFRDLIEWVPVCPEVEYGLPVPREPMQLQGTPEAPSLVTIHARIDHTAGMKKWADKRLKQLEHEALCGFIFKSRSPSCGLKGVKVYTFSGMAAGEAPGIFAKAFIEHFPLVPVEDEEGILDLQVCEDFIKRVFALKKWK